MWLLYASISPFPPIQSFHILPHAPHSLTTQCIHTHPHPLQLESLEFQQELIEDEREETEEARQEISLAKDKSSKEKDKEKAAQALAAAAVEGYVKGAAGTGDEKAFADAPAASTVAAAVMAAAMESDVKAAAQQSASASASASSSGTGYAKTDATPLAPESPATAATAAANEMGVPPIAPDLTLHELEAITDLARESVLERERTELAQIKASIVSATSAADDDDEANARNIENKGDTDTFQAMAAAADKKDKQEKEAAAAGAGAPSSISATVSAMASTMASATASAASSSSSSSSTLAVSGEKGAEDEEEDPNVARMRNALDSMVRKLESKIDSTEKAMGDKLNRVLDTDRDGEISLEEFKVREGGEVDTGHVISSHFIYCILKYFLCREHY